MAMANIGGNLTENIEMHETTVNNLTRDELMVDIDWLNNEENMIKWNEALKEDDIDKLYTFIKQGAPYVAKYSEWGPLGLAAFCCRYDVVKTIIERHKNSDSDEEIQEDFLKQGAEALYQACQMNCGPIAEILLQQIPLIPSVHLHEAAKHGSWVVLDAIFNEYPDIDVDTLNNNEATPLHIAASHSHLPTIRFLLDKKADPNKKNKLGHSAIHLACIKSEEDVIQLLITHGANVNILDDQGRGAVHYAAECGCDSIISVLAHAGADLDRRDNAGNVALITAAKNGYTLTLKELILNGASLEVIDNQRFNALERAIQQRRDITAATYIRLEPNENYIYDFVTRSEISMLKIVKNGLTETLVALLDRMVQKDRDHQINNAIILTKYLYVDEKKKMPKSVKGYDKNKTTLLRLISEVGEKKLAYHGVIRILVDHKMKKIGNAVLLLKYIFYVLFLLCLAYSLIDAAHIPNPFKSYTNNPGPSGIIRILTELYVLFYWIINIATEAIEFFRTVRISHSHLKSKKEVRKADRYRELAVNEHTDEYNQGVPNIERKELTMFGKLNRYLLVRIFVDYFKDQTNYLDVLGLGTIGILILLRLTQQPAQWIFATFAFFINCIRLFKLITLTPILGPYSIIILQILINDVPRFAGMFILTLLIYTGCFFIALRTPYSAIGFTNISLGLTEDTVRIPGIDDKVWWVLLSGFRTLLEGNIIDENYLYRRYNWLAASIYLGFLFLTVVVYLNVFIAQLSDTYAITKQKADIYSASFRLNYIVQLQSTSLLSLCFDLRKKYFISKIHINKYDLEKYFGVQSLPAFRAKTMNENLDIASLISRIGKQQKIGRRSQEITINGVKNVIRSTIDREDKVQLSDIDNYMISIKKDINELSQKRDFRIQIIEEKINEINQKMDDKINDLGQKIEVKINEFGQKMDLLLASLANK